MYLPDAFREERFEVLSAFVRAHPLGVLIATTVEGLSADCLPMLLDGGEGDCRLRGHLARANPLWRRLAEPAGVLVLFQGAQHYVTPNAYPSKREGGEVVPTWNYSLVQARGSIRWIQEETWLRSLVSELTERHEQSQASPWRVTDAPARYLQAQLGAIVGFEICIESLLGKFKASQNRSPRDRAGVRTMLNDSGVSKTELDELVREG